MLRVGFKSSILVLSSALRFPDRSDTKSKVLKQKKEEVKQSEETNRNKEVPDKECASASDGTENKNISQNRTQRQTNTKLKQTHKQKRNTPGMVFGKGSLKYRVSTRCSLLKSRTSGEVFEDLYVKSLCKFHKMI